MLIKLHIAQHIEVPIIRVTGQIRFCIIGKSSTRVYMCVCVCVYACCTLGTTQ